MINKLDKDKKKPLTLLFVEYFKADFKDPFWEKQSLFIMTFIISNFFQNSYGHNTRLSSYWLTSQERGESDLSLRLCH